MFGKIIILLIGVMAVLGMLYKFASSFGLVKPQLPTQKSSNLIDYRGFRLTKFNIAMLCLVGLYLLWGVTQLFR